MAYSARRVLSDCHWSDDATDPTQWIGWVIQGATTSLDDEGYYTRFTIEFEQGIQRFEVVGGCCSKSWIEHLEVPRDLSGAVLLSIEEPDGIELEPCSEGPNRYIQVYQTKFHTTKGTISLEYRNSSNGYYGGWLKPIGPLEVK